MLGLTYCLVASGITLIFGVMRIVNFAHGEFYVLGAFAIYLASEAIGLPYYAGLVLTILVIGIIGFITERIFFRPLRWQEFPSFILSLGLLLLIQGTTMLVFGHLDRGVTPVVKGVWKIGDVFLPKERMVVVIGSIVVILALHSFLKWFKPGQAMRAVAQEPEAATLCGVNIDLANGLAFGIGCALAAAAGGLLAPLFVVNPFLGGFAVVRSFLVMVIAGMGSISGAIVGGLILGAVESFGYTFFGGIAQIFSFIIVMVLLIFRPQGLFGRE
jgi:branched-chain amino acid transport system permease protein